jgi:RNA recognition motif-containing protein
MSSKLFVANLSWSVTEAELENLFSQSGEVVSVRIPTDRDSGRPRGFAFVEMSNPEEAQQVIRQWNGSLLHNRDLAVTVQDESRGRGAAGGGGNGDQNAGPVTETSKLFVRNLSYSVTEDELTSLFGQAGTVVSVKVPVDRDTYQPKGFAFVEMGSPDEARQAISQLSGAMVSGRPMALDFQDPNRSRSGGGGGRPRYEGGGRNEGGGGRYEQRTHAEW